MTARPALLALAFLWGWAGTARAAPTRNPDRWPSLDLNENANEAIGSNRDNTIKGVTTRTSLDSSAVNVSASALWPISDDITLQFGAGTNLSHSQSNGVVFSTTSDNSAITYLFGFRQYLLDFSLTSSPVDQNPDLWPSIGITGTGANTLSYGASSTLANTTQDLNNRTYGLTVDFRAPVSDYWTLVPSGGFSYSFTDIPHTAVAFGSRSISRTLSLGLELRYYLVGLNLIPKDEKKNPDEWSMLFFSFGGSPTLSASQDSVSTLGVTTARRKSSTTAVSAALGTRLPVTNHLTLRFLVGGSFAETKVPEQGTLSESLTRTPAINFLGQLKYYFF